MGVLDRTYLDSIVEAVEGGEIGREELNLEALWLLEEAMVAKAEGRYGDFLGEF